MITAVLSNSKHPEYGVITIRFPIAPEDYDNIIGLLESLEIGDAAKRDCCGKEISGAYPILKRLMGDNVNIDKLGYLVKRLDSFDKNEIAKFQASAVSGKR